MSGAEQGGFLRPSPAERLVNRIVGLFFGLGIGFSHNYVLEVRGRKSGNVYSTPVDVLAVNGRIFLVCPRGRAQWVRNLEASGRAVLRRRGDRREYSARAVLNDDKPQLLKEYLDRFKRAVQRYFP